MKDIEISMPLYEARISVTGKCNHNCIYCGPFSDGKRDHGYGKLSLEQITLLAPLIKKSKLHTQLTGGEPTLRKDLRKIIEILKRVGIEDIGMTTNGSSINPEYISDLISAGIFDVHIHLPSLDNDAYKKTTRTRKRTNIEGIKDTALYLKLNNVGIEFNVPVTRINLPTLPELLDFCYENQMNLKLIEEVNLSGEQVKEEEISSFLERWFEANGLNLDEINIDKKYGRIYQISEDFSFRIAPATKGLVNYLNGKKEKILYDGRYWIGGKNGSFLFTPSYFLEPSKGKFEDLEKNLNETRQIYDENDKK